DGAERRLIDVAGRLDSVRALPLPHRDRRVLAPSSVDRADREMHAIEIHLRLEYGRSLLIAGDRHIHGRAVDRIHIEMLERFLHPADELNGLLRRLVRSRLLRLSLRLLSAK